MNSNDNSGSTSAAPAPDICWKNAVQAVEANDQEEAVAWFRRCVDQAPEHPHAALNLGILLAEGKHYSEAIVYLNQAIKLKSDLNSVSALARALANSGNLDEAKKYYRDILNTVPEHIPTLLQLGEISERGGDRRSARTYYKQAMLSDEADLAVSTKYAISSWDDDPAETAAILDKHLARADLDDIGRLKIILNLIIYKEFHERIKRGLMPYHATKLEELFFTYAEVEFSEFRKLSRQVAETDPTNTTAQIRQFISHFCSRDRQGAQEWLLKFQPKLAGHTWETVTFDPAFYRSLETFTEADLLKGLPPVESVLSIKFSRDPVAYLSCNYLYFESFAAPMLRSLENVAPGAQVHVHIMDISARQLEVTTKFCQSLTSLSIALSVEQPGVDKKSLDVARAYYHAIRFIRFYQHLLQHKQTLWLMDVDALFNKDPKVMYDVLGDKDAAMRIRAGRLEPWNQFNACIVAGTASAESLEYFRLVAAYISHFYQRDSLRWGIDQLAMYGVFEHMRDEDRAPEFAFLDDKAIDYNYLDEGIVWCNSGRNKFLHLQRNLDGSMAIDDPDRAAYIKLFDRYYTPLGA